MPTYSHSRLNTYETCPLKYQLQYIGKIKVEKGEGIESFLGSRVHDALERLYKDLRYSKLLTIDELISFYNELWAKKWNDAIVIRKKELSAQNYKDTGIRCLKNYYERYAPFNQAATIGIEEDLSFSLSGDGKYKIKGYIDRLDRTKDGVYEIHDYKTSGSLPLQESLDADRQLALYEIGIRKKNPNVKEVRLIWHYLVFDADVSSTRTAEQLEDLKKETIGLIDKIEADNEFKHNENPLCEWCDYWAYCPAKKHLVKVEALPPEEFLSEDGVMLVNKYASAWDRAKEAEEEKERLRLVLIAYAQKEGVETIIGSDRTVKVTFEESLKFPSKDAPEREELNKIIKAAGLWEEVSELDKKSLEEAIETGKWDKKLIKKIKEFASMEESASVRISRQKALGEEEEEEE
jgi:putative RecB family exonuclease